MHHAGLSDEARSLIEWLTEERHIRVLCATSTISQGINFPVSSVFLSSHQHRLSGPPFRINMSPREFWNLAGRAGRIDQDAVGIVGIAAGQKATELVDFVKRATESLVSRLVTLLDEVEREGKLRDLSSIIAHEDWRDFRSYIAHLWAEKKSLEAVLADTEQVLRHTYGFGKLRSDPSAQSHAKAEALLEATKAYVKTIAEHPENATLADATGFDPDGVRTAILSLNQLEHKLTPADWHPESLFGPDSSSLQTLFGVMLRIPVLSNSLKDISSSGLDKVRIAKLTSAWVNGGSIQEIAQGLFMSDDTDSTAAITNACKAIYKCLVNSGAWGLAALSKMPTSGLNFENLSDDARAAINALPSMIYHGVRTEAAVVMRMNSVPRSIAETLGRRLRASGETSVSVGIARAFLRNLPETEWNSVVPSASPMSGRDYRAIWKRLSGDSAEAV